ncbi:MULTISPECIES: hypothetical protein [unclassified Brevundimonas]|uniref:hypothetical protein n=1 Tax=unclassified Brevundimonas TaxID=2622653 RepID=UPI0025BD5940|nr:MULTISPECIES: hypothetical protein [unclassified Brevundimonas]
MGAEFAWPAGIVVQEPIDAFDEDRCGAEEDRPLKATGASGNVRLCLSLINTTSRPIQVRLPAGLIFVSLDTESQNGLLLQIETFEVPPGDMPYFVDVGLQCLNAGRSPGFIGDRYRPGPVTEDPALLDFVALIQDKALTLENAAVVQDTLWRITDGEGLTAADRRELARLERRPSDPS